MRRSPRSPTGVQVAVLGSVGVGKSGLVTRQVTKMFVQDYDPSIEDTYRQAVTLEPSTASKGSKPAAKSAAAPPPPTTASRTAATKQVNASKLVADIPASNAKESAVMRKVCTYFICQCER